MRLDSVARSSRADILATSQGLITETFPRALTPGASIMIDGTIYVMGVALRAGDVVANLSIIVTVIGATVTVSKVGLYDKTGVRLAVSVDQGTAWQSTGLKTVAMIAPYKVPADDFYYTAVISKATTLPTLSRASSTNAPAVSVAGGVLPYGAIVTQTDLPTPITIVAGNSIAYWIGVS